MWRLTAHQLGVVHKSRGVRQLIERTDATRPRGAIRLQRTASLTECLSYFRNPQNTLQLGRILKHLARQGQWFVEPAGCLVVDPRGGGCDYNRS